MEDIQQTAAKHKENDPHADPVKRLRVQRRDQRYIPEGTNEAGDNAPVLAHHQAGVDFRDGPKLHDKYTTTQTRSNQSV